MAHLANLLNVVSSTSYFSLIFVIFFKIISSNYFESNRCDKWSPENDKIYLSNILGKLSKFILFFMIISGLETFFSSNCFIVCEVFAS
jgi:hypothetical protein